MREYVTRFGSLDSYEKGGVEIIDDDPRRYAFSNVFDVAAHSKPYEKVAVGKNRQYVLEAIRAEGDSEWRAAPHDEFALVMDGEVEVVLHQLVPDERPAEDTSGSVALGHEPAGPRDGPGGGATRAHGSSPRGERLPIPCGTTQRDPPPDHRRRGDAGALERDLSDALTVHRSQQKMAIAEQHVVRASEPNAYGYQEFTLGDFHFRRDEYFMHIAWPTGHHVMSVDAFLRALQRDVAWNFFYGIVNFDGVIGTMNHYGNVDLFAGRYNDSYRKAELDHLQNFPHDQIKVDLRAHPRRLDQRGLRPVRQSRGDGQRLRRQARRQHRGGHPPARHGGAHGRRAPATSRCAPTRPTPINRMFADVPQDQPEVEPQPGFEDEVKAFNLFAYLSRSNVTWNPSVVSVCKDSLACPTTEEYILPIIHGNDRVEWFVQLSDEIEWAVEDRDSGAARSRVVMKAGDVAAMPANIRHQGYSPKRSMLLVWENNDPDLPALFASGAVPSHPIDF